MTADDCGRRVALLWPVVRGTRPPESYDDREEFEHRLITRAEQLKKVEDDDEPE